MLQLVGDPFQIRAAVQSWRNALAADADGNIKLAPGIWGAVQDEGRPDSDKFVTTFRGQHKNQPNIVFINIQANGIDENVLGAVGVYTSGRRWILRQGFLRPNGGLDGVDLREFREFTTLAPAEVEPRPSNPDRCYYVVACVDGLAEEVQAETVAFVQECDQVRRRKYDMLVPVERGVAALSASIRLAQGVPETRLNYWRSAADRQQVIRHQTRVWLALSALVGKRMHNPVVERLAMDAMIDRPGESPLLIEIKTDSGATAIEQGFGQLLLYGGLFQAHPKGSEVELVLLLPKAPRQELASILKSHGILIATYEDTEIPTFHRDFLSLCRV